MVVPTFFVASFSSSNDKEDDDAFVLFVIVVVSTFPMGLTILPCRQANTCLKARMASNIIKHVTIVIVC